MYHWYPQENTILLFRERLGDLETLRATAPQPGRSELGMDGEHNLCGDHLI